MSLGLVVDHSLYLGYGSDVNAATTAVTSIMVSVNQVYVGQMNIQLTTKSFYVMTSEGACPEGAGTCAWNDDCSQTINTKLDNFSSWEKPAARGLWHLLTDCHQSGAVGLATLGRICSDSKQYGSGAGVNSKTDAFWLTVAHEIGTQKR